MARFAYVAAQLLAAAASVANVVSFLLENLLAPSHTETDAAIYAAAGAIGVLTVGVIALSLPRVANERRRAAAVAVALVLTVLAGFAPRLVEAARQGAVLAQKQEEDRRLEEAFQRELAARRADVAARIAGHRPFAPKEALDLVAFVDGSDLSYRGLPDHSEETFALLQRSLDGKILDPNLRVPPTRANEAGDQPLFVAFYRAQIAPGGRVNAIRTRQWNLLQLLVKNGADLSDPAAAELAADLGKTAVPIQSGRFMRLQ